MYAVYRHFDEADRLLYVGRSRNPIARMNGHRGHSEWFTKIAKITIEKFDSLAEASQAEVDAIKAEKPLHNVQHTKASTAKPALPMPFYDITESELSERVYAFLAGYDRYEYGWCGWDKWKRSNPDLIRYVAVIPLEDIKPMSEQSYRNWKSKNFAGYQIPNDDDVIEANSEDET